MNVLGIPCPRKYSGMSSKIQRDVLGNTGNVLDVLGNTGNRNVLDVLGNTAGSVPGLSGSETHLLDSEIFLGMSSKFCDVLENPKMSRIFSHVLENPKSNLSSKL